MKNELLKEFKRMKGACARKDAKLREKLNSLTDAAEINATKDLIRKNRATYDEVIADEANYKGVAGKVETLEQAGDQKAYYTAYIDFLNYEESLIKKYNVVVEPEVKDEKSEVQEVVKVTQPEVKKEHSHSGIIAWSLIGGLAAGALGGYLIGNAKKCDKPSNLGNGQTATVIESDRQAEVTQTQKPFEVYGQFTDVNNEKQLRARAEWFYNNYIANAQKSKAGARQYSVEDIMNLMRVVNGEFMRDASGNVIYNDTDIIAAANDLHTIANYDSFVQYGNQIYFTPLAPLFVDGSLAQQGAVDLDNAMVRVVNAIRAGNNEEFVNASREWGAIVLNMFNYVDYTGEYVNIYQVDAPTSFALFHAMNAKYASTILEYSEANHLSICVPYCVDYNTGEQVEEPLSQIMYNLNERAIDAVAVRSGNLEEYEANNLSLPERLYVLAKDYYNSKYQIEMGQSRILK